MARLPEDRFTPAQIKEMLKPLTGWSYDAKNKCIAKEFDRKNFLGSAGFIQQIAGIAELADHHPDLLLSGYKNVKVMLSTHSAKGVTQSDFDLARSIEKIK